MPPHTPDTLSEKTFPPAIDLFSDTVTRPGTAMRRAMADAEVGDEQLREDPTVNRLVARVCELLGTEDAVFLPTGTMCNQISLRVHCSPGDEVIMDHSAHVRSYETGGPAALSGVNVATLSGSNGVFSARQLREAIRPPGNHFPRTRCVVLEQTANLAGGAIWPIDSMRQVCAAAAEAGLARHLDGARLFNAVVETGVSATDYCSDFNSVWIDFSKGLGAPIGAALAGSREFIEQAWRFKHQFGGAMRQAGIVAAAALYALDHNVERLAEDHRNARRFAAILAESAAAISVEPVHSNMVFFTLEGVSAERFAATARQQGVRFSVVGPTRLRAVTHLDVTTEQVEQAARIVVQLAEKSAETR